VSIPVIFGGGSLTILIDQTKHMKNSCTSYEDFLAGKKLVVEPSGFDVPDSAINQKLFPFQRAIVRWSLQHGRSAVLASTGLGKGPMEMEWAHQVADYTKDRVIGYAPLAVCRQFAEIEAPKFGYDVKYVRNQAEADACGLSYVVTNFERIGEFDHSRWKRRVIDESSILKSLASKTRQELTEGGTGYDFKLDGTATPAPNDIVEIANHAEDLEVMTRMEMLAAFFVNAGINGGANDGWRLKRHAATGPFWRWFASWAMSVTVPSDLGFDDGDYILPPLNTHLVTVDVDIQIPGKLFVDRVNGVGEYSKVRHATITDRVAQCREIVLRETDQQWLIWCDFNDEDEALCKAIPDLVSVRGNEDPEEKAAKLVAFGRGEISRMVTKPGIAAMGLNYQTCSRMLFCGLSFSWEMWFQAIRRCWRFGQKNPVDVYAVVSSAEMPVWEAIQRKEREAHALTRNLIDHVSIYERAELAHTSTRLDYSPSVDMIIPAWVGDKTHACC
jgi:hypothetical protein